MKATIGIPGSRWIEEAAADSLEEMTGSFVLCLNALRYPLSFRLEIFSLVEKTRQIMACFEIATLKANLHADPVMTCCLSATS